MNKTPNKQTIKAMQEARNGKTHKAKSVDELFWFILNFYDKKTKKLIYSVKVKDAEDLDAKFDDIMHNLLLVKCKILIRRASEI